MPRKGGVPENLISIADRPNAQELRSKGGQKAGEVCRRKKFMRDTLKNLLAIPFKEGKLETGEYRNLIEAQTKNLTVEEVMLISQLMAAISGDTKAATFIRDTSGNKPEEVQNLMLPDADNAITIRVKKYQTNGVDDETDEDDDWDN